MKVKIIPYPEDYEIVKGDNYIPETIIVAGCNWFSKNPGGQAIALTFISANKNVNVEELAFQIMLSLDQNDINREMKELKNCPLLDENMSEDMRGSYEKIFEDKEGDGEDEIKRSYGYTNFAFYNTGKKHHPYVLELCTKVDHDKEKVYVRDIFFTREQYLVLNTYISQFRLCHWLSPMIFMQGVYKNALPDIEIQSIMHIGTTVLEGGMTASVFEIYPRIATNTSYQFVIMTGMKKPGRFLKKTIQLKDFFNQYKNLCIAGQENMISVYTPEFRVYITLKTPNTNEPVRVYYMSKETATRLNFFDWDKVIYL